MASLMTYSRSIGPRAARPSPPRENRVRPAPFNWMSTSRPDGVRCSPSRMARPSPSMVKPPNWCPAYAWAIGREPAGRSWPANRAAAASGDSAPRSRPSSSASRWFRIDTRGSRTAAGVAGAKRTSGSRE